MLSNRVGARVGDRVVIRIQTGAALRGALMSYGVGALLLLGGALLGHAMAGPGQHDFFALVGGLSGLVITVVCVHLLHRSRNWRGLFAMEMIGVDRVCQVDPEGLS